jgi:SP family sugar:H+ symporter-like MFS transporter
MSRLFDGNIIKGATYDTIPAYSRAKRLCNATNLSRETDEEEGNITEFPAIHVGGAKGLI